MTQHGLPQNPAPDSHVYLYPYPSSLRSWRMVASRPVSPQTLNWLHCLPETCLISDSFALLLLVQVFPPSGFFSSSLGRVQVSSNLKTNKTSSILHASSIYHCVFSFFMQTSGVTSIPFWHFLLSIQSSNRYNLASVIQIHRNCLS